MDKDHVSFDRADQAVMFIKAHAEKYGKAVGRVKGLEHQRKVVRSLAFLDVTEFKNVAEREAKAEVSEKYQAITKDIENAWADMETLKAKMKYSEMVFDLYRSSNKWGGP